MNFVRYFRKLQYFYETDLVYLVKVVMVPDSRLHSSHTDAATVSLQNLHTLKLEDFNLPPYPYK